MEAMIEFDVDMSYLIEEGELDGVVLNDENGEHEPMTFWPGGGECELEPLPAIVVTMNMLNEIGWCKCSECGYATPDDSNYCQNCVRKAVMA